jgi:hypothetical protein
MPLYKISLQKDLAKLVSNRKVNNACNRMYFLINVVFVFSFIIYQCVCQAEAICMEELKMFLKKLK